MLGKLVFCAGKNGVSPDGTVLAVRHKKETFERNKHVIIVEIKMGVSQAGAHKALSNANLEVQCCVCGPNRWFELVDTVLEGSKHCTIKIEFVVLLLLF
jgi:hypothetical protein